MLDGEWIGQLYIDNLLDALLLAALSLGSDFTADKPPKASGRVGHYSSSRLGSAPSPGVINACVSLYPGKAYFISDGQPVNQFEFLRPLVEALEKPFPTINVSTTLMYYVAWVLELFYW